MTHDTIVVLGVPLDNLSFSDTLTAIFAMLDDYKRDQRPRLLATVNVDFIVNTLSWKCNKPRHPELLDILRRADLVVADGMPVVWASKFLGTPLRERVAGSDLVPALAAATRSRPLSCYFLGGRGDIAARAAQILQEKYPNLHIAGVDASFVHVAGEALWDAPETDQVIVDKINQSHPDILFIALGNPKQEIWFDRNRFRLQVPVSIGVGGTFEFIVGTVPRAPLWMQKAGLEWVHRIIQDPWRLWKRYLVDFYKFGLLILPSILNYRLSRWWRRVPSPQSRSDHRLQLTATVSPAAELLHVVTLPPRLDAMQVHQVRGEVEAALQSSQELVLDFFQVTFLDSSGLGQLIKSWRQAQERGKGFFLINVNQTAKRFFELNRLWDIFRDLTYSNIEEMTAALKQQKDLPSFNFPIEPRPYYFLLSLKGRLDAAAMAALDLPAILQKLNSAHVIINLDHLTFVDSSGLSFFLKIQRHVVGAGKSCYLCGMTPNVQQIFLITRLNQLFNITPDITSSEQSLGIDYASNYSTLSEDRRIIPAGRVGSGSIIAGSQ
jgi:N-acetylglucosaminyldiphosphoundecaprenol N-acetyl-beta-D-mannosaminyltransferase